MRRGYSRPHLLLRLIGYSDLLCDGCNLNYRSFTIPGTVPESSRSRKRRRHDAETKTAISDEADTLPHSNPSPPNEEKTHSANPLAFLRYYLKLRLDVMLGRHRTPRPLDLDWRWRHWKQRRKRKG
ncbi:MAG: hypothetical protein ACR2G4_16695 [Pyrinomonadaceae bacterium]